MQPDLWTMSRVHIFLTLQSSLKKISICFKRKSMFLWQRKLFVSLLVRLPGSYLLSTPGSHQPSSSVLWAQGCSSTDLIRSDYIFVPYSILSGPDGSLYVAFPTLMGTDSSMLWRHQFFLEHISRLHLFPSGLSWFLIKPLPGHPPEI